MSAGGATIQATKLAILFLALVGLKPINDSLGHNAGDILPRTVAEQLTGCARRRDTVARLGGDEFAIILENVAGPDESTAGAQRLLETLAQPVALSGREVFIGASVGIALYPRGGEGATPLKNADTVLYRAKDSGRNTYEYDTEDMGVQVQVRMSLEHSIRRALEQPTYR